MTRKFNSYLKYTEKYIINLFIFMNWELLERFPKVDSPIGEQAAS
jgi:hypothetical protein